MKIKLPIILPEESESIYTLIDISIVNINTTIIIGDNVVECDLSNATAPNSEPYFLMSYRRYSERLGILGSLGNGILITDGIRCALTNLFIWGEINLIMTIGYYTQIDWPPPSRKFIQDAIRTLVEWK